MLINKYSFLFYFPILIGFFICNIITAQITFEVNFEQESFGSFMDHPEFTLIDNDGLEPKFEGMGRSWYHPSVSVRRPANSTSKFKIAGSADNWLITPRIFVPMDAPYLKWVSATIFDNLEEDYEILISIKNTNPKNFDLLTRITEKLHDYTTHDISLDQYAGDSIYIAFRHISNDQRELLLQKIVVGGRLELDLDILNTSVEKYVIKDDPNKFDIEIQNNGTKTVRKFRVNWQIDSNKIQHQWIMDQNLNWDEITTIEINNPLIINEMRIAQLKVWVDSINDGTTDDNFTKPYSQKVYPVDDFIPKNVYIEEMTATWCQACPPGGLIFQELLSKYKNLIGASFHKDDIMTAQDMQPIIDEYAAFLPGGLVDRVPVDGKEKPYRNVGQWETGIIDQLSKVTPVDIDINIDYNETSREINILLVADFYVESDITYRLNIVVVEDSVTGGELYDQANAGNNNPLSPFYMKGDPIKGFVHRHVIRELLGGAWGYENDEQDNTHSGDRIVKLIKYVIPDNYNIEQIKFIGLVQEYNEYLYDRRILNCVQSESIITSSTKHQSNSDIQSYPNPTSDFLILENYMFNEPLTVIAVSIDGKEYLLEDWYLNKTKMVLNVQDLPSGTYQLRINSRSNIHKEETKIVRFVIQR